MIVGQPLEQLVEPDTMNEKNLLQYTQFENLTYLISSKLGLRGGRGM